MFLNITKENPLTPEVLAMVPNGEIFATGQTTNDDQGCNITGNGDTLTWIAKKGGIEDWAIYVSNYGTSIDEIGRHGDKPFQPYNIRACVPCTDEALALYRR